MHYQQFLSIYAGNASNVSQYLARSVKKLSFFLQPVPKTTPLAANISKPTQVLQQMLLGHTELHFLKCFFLNPPHLQLTIIVVP